MTKLFHILADQSKWCTNIMRQKDAGLISFIKERNPNRAEMIDTLISFRDYHADQIKRLKSDLVASENYTFKKDFIADYEQTVAVLNQQIESMQKCHVA